MITRLWQEEAKICISLLDGSTYCKLLGTTVTTSLATVTTSARKSSQYTTITLPEGLFKKSFPFIPKYLLVR